MSFKNSPIGMISALTITSLVIGLGLAGFFIFAEPRIEINRLIAEKKAIFSVIDGAADYKIVEKEITVDGKLKQVKYFEGTDKGGNTVGYAYLTQAPGYSAAVKIMMGLNIDQKRLLTYTVVEHIETPGLGTKMEEPPFQDQFTGLHLLPKVTYIKNRKSDKNNVITAISGATITSKAVVNAINYGTRDLLLALEK